MWTYIVKFCLCFYSLGLGEDINLLVVRRIYPCLVTSVITVAAMVFHLKQFKKLYEHIKNDKWVKEMWTYSICFLYHSVAPIHRSSFQ